MRAAVARQAEVPLGARPRLLRAVLGQPQAGTKRFRLSEVWSLLVFHYAMEAEFDDLRVAVRPGTCALLPPDCVKVYHHAGAGLRHLAVHFQLDQVAPRAQAPWLIDLGGDYAAFDRDLTDLVAWQERDRLRAEIRLWDVLHRLCAVPAIGSPPPEHPALAAARREIELAIADPLRLSALARRVGVSHGHLCALFRAAHGTTPGGYLRARRLAVARHLLERSTKPMRAIAAEVGMGDVQSFNKAVRRAFGLSPRRLREAGRRRDG